jgi:hypothetical protein
MRATRNAGDAGDAGDEAPFERGSAVGGGVCPSTNNYSDRSRVLNFFGEMPVSFLNTFVK